MNCSDHNQSGSVTTVVIGAGHAGLAISHCLTQRSIEHVLLERGEVANAWRTERWDSLRLLTPNWQSTLPGYRYEGSDPNGFMTMNDVTTFIDQYSRSISAPVITATTVTSVTKTDRGYRVQTNRGVWTCQCVVLASGICNTSSIPTVAQQLPKTVHSVTPLSYRNPDQLAPGGVLVVGASATGLQLAQEIQRSGRDVVLSAGEHVRMPRTYRGHDIQWWMQHAGLLDQRIEHEADINRARRLPSPQLIGTPERRSLDLNELQSEGVTVTGRLAGISQGNAQFSGSLQNCCALADLKLNRLLDRFDQWSTDAGMDEQLEPCERFAPTRSAKRSPLTLDLNSGRINTVLWATGFRPDYSWLHLPVLDNKGKLIHDRGIVGSSHAQTPGLYAMGLSYMRRRKSSFICGA